MPAWTAGDLRCSKYLVKSADAADRWSAERPDRHGNTGMIPWNKCPELLTTMVRECLEVYTYTDPSSGVAAADDLAKRRWSSTAVSCVRDLYDKFLELWGESWQEATERTRRAKQLRAQEEAGEGEERQEERHEERQEERQEPMPQQDQGEEEQDQGEEEEPATTAAGGLAGEHGNLSFSSFNRQISGINAGDCVALCKACYEHNKCSECKELELTIKEEGMQEAQDRRRLTALPDNPGNAEERHRLSASAERHSEAQRTALHKYRQHNYHDYHQRFHFTHIRRVTQALDERRKGPHGGQLGAELSDAEFRRQLAEAHEPQRAPEMAEFYSNPGLFEEPALVKAYTPDPCEYSDVVMHRPQTGRGAAKFVGLSHVDVRAGA